MFTSTTPHNFSGIEEPPSNAAMTARFLLNLLTPFARRRVIYWPEYRDLLHSHNVPEDPEWPTPTSGAGVRRLMRQLSRRARIFCALLAVGTTYTYWLEWARGNDDVMGDALKFVRLYLAHQRPCDDPFTDQRNQLLARLLDAREAADLAELSGRDAHGHTTSPRTAREAGCAIQASYSLLLATTWRRSCVDQAADAVCNSSGIYWGIPTQIDTAFLVWWWRECRARMALANPSFVEFEIPGTPNPQRELFAEGGAA